VVPAGASLGTVGGYRLVRHIGTGGMGAVYEAEQRGTGRRVAVKLIRPEFAASPEAVQRFRREGRVAGTVTHPRCVFVVTADEDAGQPYMVMELMPGATLKDLVDERGALPPAAAVARMLDVIDGLQALHRRGLVHRDVKPANCFLEENGRVKVGDFGLARSLLAGGELTQTGRFLGTPLFASPEQLKGGAVDARTDVYSVAATLYYLLTGRAPFQGGDAASVAARVASEPAPSMLSLRPGLPRDLDRVVLRGLARDPRRRWRHLGELRAALLRFGPARPSIGDVWARGAAYLIDYAVVAAVWLLLHRLLRVSWPELPAGPEAHPDYCSGTVSFHAGPTYLSAIPDIIYFGLCEGLWGCGLGKWLLRLRVIRPGSTGPPGVPRALLRAAVFCLLMYLPRHLLALATLDCLTGMLLSVLAWWNLGGLLMVASTMRRRNGYRGLHEFASGTGVIRASWTENGGPERVLRRDGPERLPDTGTGAAVFPAAVGPFRVGRALGWAEGGGVLLAEDAVLERKVLLWVRPAAEPSLTPARCDVNRPARLRWLAAGFEGTVRWDAFIAEGGSALPDVVAAEGTFSWEAARELLRQLTDELADACAEGTLPHTLSPAQVLVRPDGHVLLLDVQPPGPNDDPATVEDVKDQHCALELLRRVTVLTLEGRERAAGGPVRAPLPLYASRMLARLGGAGEGYGSAEDFRRALAETEEWPARVSRSRRTFHLLIQAGLLLAALFLAILGMVIADNIINRFRGTPGQSVNGTGFLALSLIPVLNIFWACLARGGPSFGLCGVALVRADGRRVARWQAALRSFLVWVQGCAILFGSGVAWNFGLRLLSGRHDMTEYVWTLCPASLVAYAGLTAWLPRRPLHDRIARTYLVPK
jgi:hypothetical protein